MDSDETRAIACSGQTARRTGHTLFVRLESGREMAFVDDTGGEAPGGFHYAGRIALGAFQLIESWGHESYPQWIVLSARTGRSVIASDVPLLSPDSRRYATGGPAWENCAEGGGATLDVWRLMDTLPLLEWRVVTQDCKNPLYWGASNLRWRSPDTLEFTRNDKLVVHAGGNPPDSAEYLTRPALAVRDDHGWRIVDRPNP